MMPNWLGTFLEFYALSAAVVFLGGCFTLCRLDSHRRRPAAATQPLRFLAELVRQPKDMIWLLIISLAWPLLLGATLFLLARSMALSRKH